MQIKVVYQGLKARRKTLGRQAFFPEGEAGLRLSIVVLTNFLTWVIFADSLYRVVGM